MRNVKKYMKDTSLEDAEDIAMTKLTGGDDVNIRKRRGDASRLSQLAGGGGVSYMPYKSGGGGLSGGPSKKKKKKRHKLFRDYDKNRRK